MNYLQRYKHDRYINKPETFILEFSSIEEAFMNVRELSDYLRTCSRCLHVDNFLMISDSFLEAIYKQTPCVYLHS